MKNEPNYLIKDLADKTGLSHDTIRFYEKKQLIQPSFRGSNNYRYYNDDALKRLLFIKRCRALDMTLKEIQSLIALEQNPEQDCSAVNNLIDAHLQHVESRIAELLTFRLQLQQLRQSCSAQSTVNQCQILKKLETADEQACSAAK